MKTIPKITGPRIVFLIIALGSWWVTGRYASTGQAVVRTLAGEAKARLDQKGAAAADLRMKSLIGAGTSAGKIAAVLAGWQNITDVLELRRLYESCAKLEEPWRSLARQEAIRRWLAVDPKSAASYALAHQDQAFLKEFLAYWSNGLSPNALAASIKEIFGDPRNFAALIPGKADQANYQISVKETKSILGNLDPFTVAQAWARLGFAKMPGDSIFALFQSSAARDPDAAAALAAAIPDEKVRKIATDAVLAGLALADPVKALAQVPPDWNLRFTLYEHAFSTLAATNPQLGMRLIEKLPTHEDQGTARLVFSKAWMKIDPAAAAAYAQEFSSPQLRRFMSFDLISAAEAGITKAPDLQVISQLQDPAMRRQLGGSALSQSLQQTPDAFPQQWDALTPQQQAESLAGMAAGWIGKRMLQSNWTELAPRVMALQGAALETALAGDALGAVWAQQDPVSLLRALEQHPNSAAAENATVAAVQDWAAQALPAATAYVAQIPPGPRQEAARRALERH